MKYFLSFFCSAILTVTAFAQETYTNKLRKNEVGCGTVIINQSSEIEDLVNNTVKTTTHRSTETSSASKKGSEDHEAQTNTKKSSSSSKTYVTRTRHKAKGYRICIFTGGNSKADKTKAVQMGNKCREKFGELAVYPRFIAPRWVTHVGDFKTKQDAQKYVSLIRSANFTYEVRIIPSEVNIPD